MSDFITRSPLWKTSHPPRNATHTHTPNTNTDNTNRDLYGDAVAHFADTSPLANVRMMGRGRGGQGVHNVNCNKELASD